MCVHQTIHQVLAFSIPQIQSLLLHLRARVKPKTHQKSAETFNAKGDLNATIYDSDQIIAYRSFGGGQRKELPAYKIQ